MQSKASTVDEYLASLPPDRAAALAAVRGVVLDNLDPAFEEGMQYGMIGWFVPHSRFPAGYHCDPAQPLPYMGLASQKQYMSLYVNCLYTHDGPPGEGSELMRWFHERWASTGKKLDMGKSCVRFKRLEELALDVIGETVRRVDAASYVDSYVRALQATNPKAAARVAKLGGYAALS